jgi:hypothetical protein
VKTARIWHDPDLANERPWGFLVRIPSRGGDYKVVGGSARTHAEAMEQIREAWNEHTPDQQEAS